MAINVALIFSGNSFSIENLKKCFIQKIAGVSLYERTLIFVQSMNFFKFYPFKNLSKVLIRKILI